MCKSCDTCHADDLAFLGAIASGDLPSNWERLCYLKLDLLLELIHIFLLVGGAESNTGAPTDLYLELDLALELIRILNLTCCWN